MSGDILMPGSEHAWSASSGVFYWVVDFLADAVTDPEAEQHLRDISAHGFGVLNLGDLTGAQRGELLEVMRGPLLPAVQERFPLPDGDAAQGFVRDLVGKAGAWGKGS